MADNATSGLIIPPPKVPPLVEIRTKDCPLCLTKTPRGCPKCAGGLIRGLRYNMHAGQKKAWNSNKRIVATFS